MYHLSVFIHILSAIFWIGGMLFTAAVLVPASRHQLLKNKKGAFFALVGKKFSRISWVLFLILIVTGITNLLARGFSISDLVSSFILEQQFGQHVVHQIAPVWISDDPERHSRLLCRTKSRQTDGRAAR
ncbi:MAG: hypothetical protein U5J63_17795 [Fodinibius sp.]|nr:hypothetical protein [Fodinibius sp.]